MMRGIDKNHNPRKGTETSAAYSRCSLSAPGDKNHNPRKGTETSFGCNSLSLSSGMIKTIIPVRGRKRVARFHDVVRELEIRTTIPVRGRIYLRGDVK